MVKPGGMAFGLTGALKQVVNRERFVEYSALVGQLARVSNSGLGWATGQAYIKGLILSTF